MHGTESHWRPMFSQIKSSKYENTLILTSDKHEQTHPEFINGRREEYLVKQKQNKEGD